MAKSTRERARRAVMAWTLSAVAATGLGVAGIANALAVHQAAAADTAGTNGGGTATQPAAPGTPDPGGSVTRPGPGDQSDPGGSGTFTPVEPPDTGGGGSHSTTRGS